VNPVFDKFFRHGTPERHGFLIGDAGGPDVGIKILLGTSIYSRGQPAFVSLS
jgi:hypothetical protein